MEIKCTNASRCLAPFLALCKYPVTVSYYRISFLATFINVYMLPFQVLPSAGALRTFLRDFAARYMCTRNRQSTIAHGGRDEPHPLREAVQCLRSLLNS